MIFESLNSLTNLFYFSQGCCTKVIKIFRDYLILSLEIYNFSNCIEKYYVTTKGFKKSIFPSSIFLCLSICPTGFKTDILNSIFQPQFL